MKELIWLKEISFLSGHYLDEHEMRRKNYPYAQILLEEVIKGENISTVYQPTGCLDKNNGKIPVKEVFVFRLNERDTNVIEEPYCPVFLKRELLPIIYNRIKPFMDNLYSLETRKQADVKNLKDAYISELEIENEHLKMQLEEIQINESEDKEKNNRASNPGSEAASEKRLQPWKDVYFPAIHAVARQCEEEGPKEGRERRQRKDIRAMLEARLLGVHVPRTVVDYAFGFLDDSLVDRNGGNT